MASEDENTLKDSQNSSNLASPDIDSHDDNDLLQIETDQCLKESPLQHSYEKEPKKKFKERVERLLNKYKSAKLIRNIDKIMFMIGLIRLVFEAYLLGRYPCFYYIYYSVVIFILVLCRFIYYRWLHWHYFLLDFCYWANLIILVFLWWLPTSEFLFISSYAFSMGPLLLAIPIFRNSMVIHSLDKITSVFLHLAPGYTLWGIRNHSCGENWAVARSIPSFYVYLLYPSVLYLVWAIVYYLIIFKLAYQRCEKKNNLTLFKYHLEDKKSFFYKLSGSFGEKSRPFTFMSVHMIFSFVTLVLTYLTLYNQYLQFGLLLFSTSQTFWTAANYYMEIFTKNYELRLQGLENLKSSLNQKKNT